jgi:hypothetical protein
MKCIRWFRIACPLGLLMCASVAGAAPISYQTAVLSNSPYAYYRLNEASGTAADDASLNSRDGEYVGGPTLGAAGAGPASDNATAFSGTGQNVTSANLAGFGSLLAKSSYEFVFKTSVTNAQMGLGGVLNTGSVTAWEISLNRNVAGATSANGVRFFLRDDSNNAIGAGFANAGVFDGRFHHLLFTYDSAGGATNEDRLKAYLDGVQQALTYGAAGGNSIPGTGTFSPFNFATAFASRQNRATTDLRFNGTLDEAALYDSTLTAADALAHATLITPEPAALTLLALSSLVGLVTSRRQRA